jgi:AcrR family transcriptional regulator
MTDPGTAAPAGAGADSASGRERARARIVEVAAGLLAAGGPDAVSTRAVALAAGTQAPAIYRLFGDKDGLLAAVAEYGFASFLARKPPLAPGGDPVADLRAGWNLTISFGVENPALYALMYSNPAGRRTAAAAAGAALLRDRIRAIAAAGRLRVSETLAADLLQAAGRGTLLVLLDPPGQAPGPLADVMFDAVTAQILTPAGPGQPEPAGTPVPAANALRAGLTGLTALSAGERHVLGEWLDRVIADGQPPQR